MQSVPRGWLMITRGAPALRRARMRTRGALIDLALAASWPFCPTRSSLAGAARDLATWHLQTQVL